MWRRSPVDPLLRFLDGFAQADHARIPNASAGAAPAVVPKVGLTPGTRVGGDNDAAVFLGNLPPYYVVGELLQDIAKQIAPIPARKSVVLFGAFQEPDVAGEIAPVLAGKCVDIFGAPQKKYPGSIENSHLVPVSEGFKAKISSLAPTLPVPVHIKPEAVWLWLSALQIALPTQLYWP
jgi:hypothetical protein